MTKKFISNYLSHLGQKKFRPSTSDQNGLYVRTLTEGKAKPPFVHGSKHYMVYGLVLLGYFFLLLFKANVLHLISVFWCTNKDSWLQTKTLPVSQ